MSTHPTRRGGFTLIELMIVVAIIGVLAAVAVPNFVMFQLRSKSGEAKSNLAAIRTAQEGYFSEFGRYVSAGSQPAAPPTPQKAAWPGLGSAPGFDDLGWVPEGEVFFRYMIMTNVVGSEWGASAIGNLDGDVNLSAYGYIHPAPGSASLSATPTNCNATGVFNPSAPAAFDLVDTVGACDPFTGQTWF